MKNQIGKLYIDGFDAFVEYGVMVSRYGYKQLIQMPPFKKLDSNDWKDEDGEEVDLSDPQLDTRTLQLEFNILNLKYAEDLFVLLVDKCYHTFNFPELKKTYRLRLTTNGKLSSLIKLGSLTLSFADDFPEFPKGNYYNEGETEIRQMGYELDDIDFSRFGIWVLKDTDSNIRKCANIKENLKVSTKNANGVLYDGFKALYKGKDVTLKLLINTTSIEKFWERYNALYAVLLQPECRTLFFEGTVEEYECYYKNNSVSKFDILKNGKVWCEFSVTLSFLKDKHNSDSILATENDICIVLEEKPIETQEDYILLGNNPYALNKY